MGVREWRVVPCAEHPRRCDGRRLGDRPQGLGATVLAGILAGSRLTGKQLLDHTFMLVGEGAGVTAVGELIADAIAHITMRSVPDNSQ